MYNLLIVDDDASILEVTRIYFTGRGYKVYAAQNGKECLKTAAHMPLDCIVLDVALPDMDGFEVCEAVKKNNNVPILFVSNYAEEDKRINGFVSGGDDYVIKPFSLRELELRICARIRQQEGKASRGEALNFGRLSINEAARSVAYEDKTISLTAAEFDILFFLANHENQVFSQKDIFERVWKLPDLGNAHTVQVHVAQIRRKLNSFSEEHQYIQTVWGKGYKFVADQKS
ncbi:MAG: Transcriptional regulatory protein SrrA [Eubacterium sp.]|uniref:response regulator transcription factor n=1 Tax=Eubacterium sp. TaxID=142586 RepID=UPI003020503F